MPSGMAWPNHRRKTASAARVGSGNIKPQGHPGVRRMCRAETGGDRREDRGDARAEDAQDADHDNSDKHKSVLDETLALLTPEAGAKPVVQRFRVDSYIRIHV